jgi:AcrR family transcriptional regulator
LQHSLAWGRFTVSTADSAPEQSGRLAERKQRTRSAILEAAARLFSDEGYDATTMQEIATLADVGLGTVYGYFPSKEDVLRTVLAASQREAAERGAHELFDVKGSVDRACVLLRQIWDYLDANRRMSLAFVAITTARPNEGPSEQARLEAILVSILTKGQEQGEVVAVPVGTTVKALLSSYTWAALRLGTWHDSDPAAVIYDLEALTRGLLTPGGALHGGVRDGT